MASKEKNKNTDNWKRVIYLVLLTLLTIAIVVVVLSLAVCYVPRIPEITLPIILIVGLLGLVTALAIIVTIFREVGLTDSKQAFGLPEGTIRATIALSLILIFAIISVFLYFQVKNVNSSQINGLTQEQFNSLPAERIISSTPNTSGNLTLYDVVVTQQNPASEDIAKQLVTTIGTLIVAVAGFYFGTRAVAVARGAQVSSQPVIRSINPNNGNTGNEYSIDISGKNFQTPHKVFLTHEDGSEEMVIKDVISNSIKIKGTLCINKNQKTGPYKLTVVNSDGAEDSLEKAFEVKPSDGKEKPADG